MGQLTGVSSVTPSPTAYTTPSTALPADPNDSRETTVTAQVFTLELKPTTSARLERGRVSSKVNTPLSIALTVLKVAAVAIVSFTAGALGAWLSVNNSTRQCGSLPAPAATPSLPPYATTEQAKFANEEIAKLAHDIKG